MVFPISFSVGVVKTTNCLQGELTVTVIVWADDKADHQFSIGTTKKMPPPPHKYGILKKAKKYYFSQYTF